MKYMFGLINVLLMKGGIHNRKIFGIGKWGRAHIEISLAQQRALLNHFSSTMRLSACSVLGKKTLWGFADIFLHAILF